MKTLTSLIVLLALLASPVMGEPLPNRHPFGCYALIKAYAAATKPSSIDAYEDIIDLYAHCAATESDEVQARSALAAEYGYEYALISVDDPGAHAQACTNVLSRAIDLAIETGDHTLIGWVETNRVMLQRYTEYLGL